MNNKRGLGMFDDMFSNEIDKVFEKENVFQVGDKINKQISDIDVENVFVDLGMKSDGIISKSELLNDDGEFVYNVGDLVEAYIIKLDDNGILLSKSLQSNHNISKEILIEAFDKQIPVEGKISRQIKGGFSVSVLGKQAFCPISQVSKVYISNPNAFIGQKFEFLVTEYSQKGRNIVISRRKLLEKIEAEAADKLIATLEQNSVVEGKVIKINEIGAFIDLGGIDGFAHISELSWQRIEYPLEVLDLDEIVKVKILSIDKDKRGKYKISLSLKQTQKQPFDKFIVKHSVNDIVEGKIKNIMNFGVFVEIFPGVEGLLHISEISFEHIESARQIFKTGEIVKTKIIGIDNENKKIALSVKALLTETLDEMREKYSVGSVHSAQIKSINKFGVFVSLTPTISGLIPIQTINRSNMKMDFFEENKSLDVRIAEVRDDGKIALAPVLNRENSDNWQSYTDKPAQKRVNIFEKLFSDIENKKK